MPAALAALASSLRLRAPGAVARPLLSSSRMVAAISPKPTLPFSPSASLSSSSSSSQPPPQEDSPVELPVSVPLRIEVAVPSRPAALAPILCLHGLFGSRSNMRTQARNLAERTGRHVGVVDMRNHGDSPHSSVMSYPAMAADVLVAAERLSAHAGQPAAGRCVLLGHSMGGKAAMTAALLRPSAVASLVVVDIAPVDYGPTRMVHSVAEAMRRVPLDTARTREEADAVLRQHLADDTIRRFVMTNFLPARDEGKPAAWRVNLDVVSRQLPTLAGYPEELLAGRRFRDPALFLHGSRSDYVQPQHHDTITTIFPSAQIQSLPTHHWVHAENPTGFVRAVVNFLSNKA